MANEKKMVNGVVSELTDEEQATLNTSRAKIQAKIDADAWKVSRVSSYGSIGDQLDEIYHDIDSWKARIAKVKSDNPKT
jgi:hypothetical protein